MLKQETKKKGSFRMLLAIAGGLCLLLLVSSVCFLKGVG